MLLTTIPMGINVLSLFGVWYGQPFDLLTQIILTIAIIAKFICCFSGAYMIGLDNPKLRNVLLALCVLMNGGIIAFSIITNSQMLLINNAVLLVLLVVWSFLMVLKTTRTWGEK